MAAGDSEAWPIRAVAVSPVDVVVIPVAVAPHPVATGNAVAVTTGNAVVSATSYAVAVTTCNAAIANVCPYAVWLMKRRRRQGLRRRCNR